MSVGPVVNMAARLEQAADPGQVLVGPTCHAATEPAARFRALGPMTFKGFTPMEVWELEALGSTTAAIDPPFVGRSSDLEILRLAYGRSAQRPVLALVSGPPGQGKTRVVRELLESIAGTPFVARFRPVGESGTAAPLRELIGGPNLGRGEVEAALAAVEDPVERERLSRAVLHSVGLEQDERLNRLPDEERTDEVVHAWRRYFAARGGPPPVVWFEDLHWADGATVRLVDRFTLSSGPLFVIATARPEFAQAAGFRPGGDRFFVELGPLEANEALALAGHAGTADAATVERAQGNPLFIVELARTAATGSSLPLTLQGALGARLDELGPDDRELLSHASVIGETFSVANAAFLSGREATDVGPALTRLADLLYLRRVGGTFRFHHNLLRDVAYGRLLVADRMGLHARLTRQEQELDPDARAHHWWEALRPPDAEWVWTDEAERGALQGAAVHAHHLGIAGCASAATSAGARCCRCARLATDRPRAGPKRASSSTRAVAPLQELARYSPGVTAPLDALLTRSKLLREWTLKVIGDLTDEQLAWRPTPTAHSIGWTLWHVARADDSFQRDLTGRSIWKDGGYRERWGFSSDRMNRMEDAAAAAMRMPSRDELLGYVRDVFAATDAEVEKIDEERFRQEIESGFMSRRCAVGDAYLASLSHDGRHLGEIEYIKGLQGLPGTATV